MYLFQRAAELFCSFYWTYHQFEHDKDLFNEGEDEGLVYLGDYILAWLIFGGGIEVCGKDFSVLMQVYSTLLIDQMQSPLYDSSQAYEESDGSADWSGRHEDVERAVANPVSALGTRRPTPWGETCDSYATPVMERKGPIHPVFLKEWFDFLANLDPSERKEPWCWISLWRARNEAVVSGGE